MKTRHHSGMVVLVSEDNLQGWKGSDNKGCCSMKQSIIAMMWSHGCEEIYDPLSIERT